MTILVSINLMENYTGLSKRLQLNENNITIKNPPTEDHVNEMKKRYEAALSL
jgi:hypothetical protein